MAAAGKQSQATALLWLIAVGVVGGLLWRLELEWHGWSGYGWTTYFHWAVPAMFLLYLVWLYTFSGIRGWRRLLMLAAVVAIAIGWAHVMRFALYYHFNWGPSALVENLVMGRRRYRLYAHLIYPLLPLTPIVFALPRLLVTGRVHLDLMALSVALMLMAVPASLFLLVITGDGGSPSTLLTIKSGYIWPWVLIAIGIPYLPRRR